MTYKQLSKRIERIDEQIEFLRRIRENSYKGMKDEEVIIGTIIDNLCAYKNHLVYDEDYTPTSLLAQKDKKGDGKS